MTEEQVPKSLCDERTANILHSVDETKEMVKDIRKLLLGNGAPGLFEQVRDLRDWTEAHEKAHAATLRIVHKVLANGGLWKLLAAIAAGLGIGGGLGALM